MSPARIFLLCFCMLVTGCATTYPQQSDIEGMWEGIGGIFTPYMLLDYESSESAHLVMGFVDPQDNEELFFVITLSDFVSREKDFTLLATFKDEETGEVQTATIEGEVYDSSQMVLHFPKDLDAEEQSFWFVRPEIFDISRPAARRFLESYIEESE